MIDSTPLIYSLAADLYVALHSKPISEQFPDTKIWEYEWTHNGNKFRVRANGTGAENDGIHPCGAHIFGNGWLVFVGDPGGGVFAVVSEDDLIESLQSEIQRASS